MIIYERSFPSYTKIAFRETEGMTFTSSDWKKEYQDLTQLLSGPLKTVKKVFLSRML